MSSKTSNHEGLTFLRYERISRELHELQTAICSGICVWAMLGTRESISYNQDWILTSQPGISCNLSDGSVLCAELRLSIQTINTVGKSTTHMQLLFSMARYTTAPAQDLSPSVCFCLAGKLRSASRLLTEGSCIPRYLLAAWTVCLGSLLPLPPTSITITCLSVRLNILEYIYSI